MALTLRKFAAVAASLSALSMAATPASAAPVMHAAQAQAYDGDGENVQHRRYRRGGVDGGDLLAGVLVIGGIAAIANATSRSRDDYRYRDNYRYRDSRYPAYPQRDYRGSGDDSRGMERAVDMCMAQVERGRQRVEDIDRAERNADGWHVSGTVDGGERFSCRIDNDGRLRSVGIDDDYSGYGNDDYRGSWVPGSGQLSDNDYARARSRVGEPPRDYRYDAQEDDISQDQPAYPPSDDDDYGQDDGGYYDGRYEADNFSS